MSDNTFKEIEEIFKFNQITNIEFKELYGFTFVFKTRTIMFHDKVSSFEINPIGIIYNENEEYYFAPLYHSFDLKAIVKEYVENKF